jgi:hypothetical protein
MRANVRPRGDPMPAIAIPARPAGHYELVPSSFVGKSGALFWRVVFRPEGSVTPHTNKKTEGMGTR